MSGYDCRNKYVFGFRRKRLPVCFSVTAFHCAEKKKVGHDERDGHSADIFCSFEPQEGSPAVVVVRS